MHNLSFAPEDIASLLGKATNWFGLDRQSSRLTRAILAFTALLYFTSVAAFQTGPINCWGVDTHILLDGGWRVLNGQIPYRDFYLALGPVEYLTIAFGMLLTGASTQAIAVGNAVFGLIIGTWGWLLCRRRVPLVPAVIITAWVILTATSPSPLGAPAMIMSCAMIYNRHGYAILSLLLIECAFANDRYRFWGGVSSGVTLVLLAFLKLNFFSAGILLLLATIPVRRVELQRAWGILAGGTLTFVVFAIYLRSALVQFFVDMGYAIHSRIGGVELGSAIRLGISSVEIATAVGLTVLAILLIGQGRDWNRFAVRTVLVCAAMIAGSLMLRNTDYGENGFQLATLWAIIMIAKLAMGYPLAKEKVAISAAILMALGGICIRFAHDADSLRTLIKYQAPSTKSLASRIPGMEHMGYYPVELDTLSQFRFETGSTYVDYIDDGLYLLNKWSRPNESILTLGYNNPFPYILRRKPATGGSPWLHEGNNISYNHPLEPSRVFGDADLIMVPRSPSSHWDSDLDLQVIYRSYLQEHFAFVAKSNWWSLYRRETTSSLARSR